MKKSAGHRLPVLPVVDNDKGFALITVIVFSVVLMATITIIMHTTMLETIMSGASTVSKRALATADAGVEYVRGSFVLVGNSFPASTSHGNYTDTVKSSSSGLPDTTKSHIVFVNLSSMGKDNSLLKSSGFSAKYLSPNSGGSGMNLSAYRCRISSVGTVNLFRKNIEFQGFSLAP